MANQTQQRFFGGVEQNFRSVTTADGPYTAAVYEALTRVDTSTGPIGAITLPNTPPVGTTRFHAFEDTGGQAGTNNILILAPGGGSINGAVSVTIDTDYGGVELSTEDGLIYTIVACCVTPPVLSFVDLSFARATEGSFLILAPTDGTVPFLSWAAAGVLRYENRGDGAGPLALLERQSTNYVLDPRVYNTGNWNASGTVTANDVPAPDGPVTAFRIQCADMAFGPYQQVGNGIAAVTAVLSGWVRSHAGIGTSVLDWTTGGTLGTAFYSTPSTTWNRVVGNPSGAFAGYFVDVNDGRDTSAIAGGHVNGARDACVDLVQVEVGTYPTSAIRGTGNAVTTRFADVLYGLVPSWILTKKIRIPNVSPVFANTDLSNGDVRWIFTLDTTADGVYIDKTAGVVTIKVVSAGVVKATSAALTFAKNALLGEVIIDPVAATVTVNGVVGAVGASWSWIGRTNIRVGGIYAGTGNELDGRIAGDWTS